MDKEKLFRQGIEQFNREEFYACHETLEEIWLQEKSGDRSFYQGLIQLAGGFHHVQKGRMGPALKALPKARQKLEKYPASHHGIALSSLLDEVRSWEEFPSTPFPKIKCD